MLRKKKRKNIQNAQELSKNEGLTFVKISFFHLFCQVYWILDYKMLTTSTTKSESRHKLIADPNKCDKIPILFQFSLSKNLKHS